MLNKELLLNTSPKVRNGLERLLLLIECEGEKGIGCLPDSTSAFASGAIKLSCLRKHYLLTQVVLQV